jgi:cell division protein FtsN
MLKRQRGSVIVGIIIGVVIGLAAALAVAVYVTKVPVPFMNKGSTGRTAEQDAAESKKNQNWDPNAPLYGKNPAKPVPQSPGIVAPAPPAAATPAFGGASSAKPPVPPAVAGPAAAASAPPRVAAIKPPAVAADPLGELAAARSSTPGADPFLYFVQVGAFRTAEDAEAHRAKLSLMGVEAKVTEREQSGRQVFRVRVGPFERKDDADRSKEKLEAGGVETALVRVQR